MFKDLFSSPFFLEIAFTSTLTRSSNITEFTSNLSLSTDSQTSLGYVYSIIYSSLETYLLTLVT